MPESQSFCGGYYGKFGGAKGGEKDSATAYIAPLQQEILDHNISYDYDYVLIVGSLQQIRGYVYDHAQKNKNPSYNFTNDRQHWVYVNATDAGWPVKGHLSVNLSQDAALISPNEVWDAEKAPVLKVDAAIKSTGKKAKVYWKNFKKSFQKLIAWNLT